MNRRRKFLLASVLALQNSSFIYPSCQKCFSRIILVSKRSNCPKCGCTGESGNANYRYKLSLKVAESNKLFVITVFGSCLDTFFGLTATGLHRYIQDPNKIPETLDNDTTQNLLTTAVETCFVGQSFIFGVTNFESHTGQGADASNFLQQCSDHKRKAKALVACQIVLPDPGVAGFTVIDYFCQLLQTFNFRKLQCDSHAPNNHLLSLNHSNSDLSSIYTSDNTSYFFKSCSKDTFSKFWQPSLEFTSIVSKLTDNDDFSASEQSKAFGTLQQNRNSISIAEATGSSSCHDPIQDSWSLVSYMDKKSTAEKLGSYDASADLFDDIAEEMDITTEITKKSQEVLLQRGTCLAESHPSESDFSLRSLSEDFIQPSQKLSLQSISDSRCSRTCSPTPQFQSDSEYNVENSQDFVPCSQSTPISGFHQTRIHGINRAFKKPVLYSDLDANYEKIRIFPENDKQQASPSCPKNIKTPSQKIRSPIVSGISQPEVFNPYPFAECHETDSDEWVPPTTRKIFPSDMLGFQVIGLGKCLAAHHFPDQELPRKKLKHIRQGTNKGLIKKKLKNMLTAVVMKEKTPKYNCKSSGWIFKCPDIQDLAAPQLHPILGPDSCLECCLPFSEKDPPSVCDTHSAWSPELFSQKVT
ncbi:DNA damage-induced apoptosis suppressor protein isoform X2 [Rhinopithecus roxellana]|uniref:DNA damage-induced apoptosis suppressor protein isoform X2 n=1 Tax=Rhinopithecus roxellana TaxID=61622 RepID=UPI001237325F|nr:DNA damage-induced apoptosis suppressor protein isoform X2 [Rhinopithecus roxellana]